MKKCRVALLMMGLGLCVIVLLAWNVSADGTGNYPAPENGDWVIENDTHVWNETIVLNGNLIIEDNGNLTFRNVTLIMNCSKNGEFGIEVKDSGKFYILDYDNNQETTNDRSNITANNPEYEFKFLVNSGAVFEMKNSELSECGYWQGKPGLTIKADNAVIDNSSFYNNWYGIYLSSSSNNQITNNSVSNSQVGIYLSSSSNNQITNNSVYSNKNYGVFLSTSTNNQITNNNVSNNWRGIFLYSSSNNQIINSTISDSTQEDFYLKSNSNITALNTTFNKDKVYFDDEFSELIVKWYLHVKVVDGNNLPIPNARIIVKNLKEEEIYNDTTKLDGWARWIECREYIQKESGSTYYTEHTIRVEIDGIQMNITTIRMDESKFIILQPLQPLEYNIVLKCDDSDKSTNPGEPATYQIKVTNKGAKPDKISLEVINQGDWFAYLNTSYAFLSPGDEKNILLTVKPGEDEKAEISSEIIVKAISFGNFSIWDSLKTTTTINQIHKALISASQSEFLINPNQTFELNLTLKNTGNGEDTFKIRPNQTASNWEIDAENITQTLNISEEILLNFIIKAPENATANSFAELVFEVNSTHLSEILSSIKIKISVCQIYKISLECENNTKETAPNKELKFSITLKNLGNGEDTIRLSLSGDISALNLENSRFTLFQGETKIINLTLKSEEDAVVNMRAISSSGLKSKTIRINSIIKLEKDYNFTLSVEDFRLREKKLTFTILVKNLGDEVSINLSVKTGYDEFKLSDLNLQLFSGESGRVRLSIFGFEYDNYKDIEVTAWSLDSSFTESLKLNKPPIARIKKITTGEIDYETLVEFDGLDSKYENLRNLTFEWDFGDGEKDFGDKTTHTFEKSGKYLVTLIVRDNSGFESEHTISVNVKNMKPDAKILLKNESLFAGELFVLTSESFDLDGEIIKFEWEIEGVKIYGESVIYSFSEAGNYTIILRVFDNLGDYSEEEMEIKVLEQRQEIPAKIEKDETDLTFVYLLGGILFILFGLMFSLMLKTRKREKVARKEKEQFFPEKKEPEIPKIEEKKISEADLWGKRPESEVEKIEPPKVVEPDFWKKEEKKEPEMPEVKEPELWGKREEVLEKKKELKKREKLEDLGEFEEEIEEPRKIEKKEKVDEDDWRKKFDDEFDLK